MSAQFYFLPGHLPAFWPDLETKAYQAIVIWDSPDQSTFFNQVFANDLVSENVIREGQSLVVRSFNAGAANPLAQSLAMLLKLPEDCIRVDQLLVLGDKKVDDVIYQKLTYLWREPAIEEVRLQKAANWFEGYANKLKAPEREDPSWEDCRPGEFGLEFLDAEKKVLQDKVKEMGHEWTRAELELIAQTWSEHCKHKIFNAKIEFSVEETPTIDSLFKTFIRNPALAIRDKKPERYLSLFHDNAGVFALDDVKGGSTDWALCVKMETHNSPSAISPYGGASTGIVGVHRDILGTGLGAMPVFNWDVLCFEDPSSRHQRPPKALHPDVIRLGVIKGIEDGGNQSGIPTVQGSVVFDAAYAVKPLVYAGSAGLMPKKYVDKKPSPGLVLFSVGGAVGADGLRGAVMSSRDIRSEDFVGSMVQVANAFVQRRVTDFLMQARDRDLIQSMTDNGAGGFASSIGEMATSTGGASIDLSNIRCKFAGLHGWERLLSESQERMSVATNRVDEFLALAKEWEVPLDRLGELNDSGRFKVTYGEQVLVDLDLDFLHDGCPQIELSTSWTYEKELKTQTDDSYEESRIPQLMEDFPEMLSSVVLCSREGVARRFDHEVQGRTFRQPFAGRTQHSAQDGSLISIYEANATAVLTHGLAPWRQDILENMLHSWDEAIRQAVIAGVRLETAAVLDNFCWPDPIGHDRRLWQLAHSCEILGKLSELYSLPFISGKDSMKNNSKDFAIPPTVVISLSGCGVAPELVSAGFFLRPNDVVFELSPLAASMRDSAWERTFKVNSKSMRRPVFKNYSAKGVEDELLELTVQLRERYRRMEEAVSKGLIRSSKDISEGGAITSIFEMCLGRELGVLFESTKPDPYHLLSEGLGGFILGVDPHLVEEIERLFPEIKRLGVVHKLPQLVWRPGDEFFEVEDLKAKYLQRGEAGFWG